MANSRDLASRSAVLFPQTIGLRWNALEAAWKGERKRSFESMHIRAVRYASERFAKQVESYAAAVEAAAKDLG